MCLRAGIAAANTSQLQYFDEPRSARRTRRDCYDDFYEQLVRVKNISVFPFAEKAQLLLVEYLRDDLDQPRAANWFLVTWTGENGHYSYAHAKYAGSNNNMGIEVDWRDMKGECPSSATLGTFTGALVGLITQLGQEHRVHLKKFAANLFPAKQYMTKRIYDKLQSVHYLTLQLAVILVAKVSKRQSAQQEWDAITERIRGSGESGAPLHLKIRAYHVDISRDDTEGPGLKLDDIATMVVPRHSYLRRIDPDGTRRFEDIKAEVSTTARRYFSLVLDPRSPKGKAEHARGLISTLDLYECFHLIRRQSNWAPETPRVALSEEEESSDTSDDDTVKEPPPPQIPATCNCKWCCKWVICEHTSLVASVFGPEYKVPDTLIAETPAARKKTNSIRGTAGVRRKKLLKEIAMTKSATKSKLTYMDRPLSPRPPQPPAEKRPARKFVIPEAGMPSDDEVLVVVLSPWPLLTDCEQVTLVSQESIMKKAVPDSRTLPPLPRIPRKGQRKSPDNQPSQAASAPPAAESSQPPSQAVSAQPAAESSQPSQRTTRSSQGGSQVRAVGSCYALPKMTS